MEFTLLLFLWLLFINGVADKWEVVQYVRASDAKFRFPRWAGSNGKLRYGAPLIPHW